MARLTITTDRPRSGVVCVALSGDLGMASAYRLDDQLRRIEIRSPQVSAERWLIRPSRSGAAMSQ